MPDHSSGISGRNADKDIYSRPENRVISNEIANIISVSRKLIPPVIQLTRLDKIAGMLRPLFQTYCGRRASL